MTSAAGRPATSNPVDPGEDHPEAITLGLHDAVAAAPGRRHGRRTSCSTWGGVGWFSGRPSPTPRNWPRCSGEKAPAGADICIYAREPHVLVVAGAHELFIDPSHTYRLRFGEESRTSSDRGRSASRCAHWRAPRTPMR